MKRKEHDKPIVPTYRGPLLTVLQETGTRRDLAARGTLHIVSHPTDGHHARRGSSSISARANHAETNHSKLYILIIIV